MRKGWCTVLVVAGVLGCKEPSPTPIDAGIDAPALPASLTKPTATTSTSASPSASASADAPPTPKPVPNLEGAVTKCKQRDVASCFTACEGGNWASCGRYADLAWPGEKDLVLGAAKRGCDAGDGHSCWAYASHRKHPSVKATAFDVITFRTETFGFHKKACDLGDGNGCASLSRDYADGHGTAVDATQSEVFMKKALELLPKGCDAGDFTACNALGFLYEGGKSVPKDKMKAVGFFKKACETGNQVGCQNAKRLASGG